MNCVLLFRATPTPYAGLWPGGAKALHPLDVSGQALPLLPLPRAATILEISLVPASPLLPTQTDNFACGLALNEGCDKVAPRFERLALLIRKAVLLINANDASERAGRMIQNFLDDGQIDAQSRQAART